MRMLYNMAMAAMLYRRMLYRPIASQSGLFTTGLTVWFIFIIHILHKNSKAPFD